MKKVYLLLAASMFLAACSDDKDKDKSSPEKQCYENGHEYVDLGLASGTMWATCNIGATNSYDFGKYYAWGETAEQPSRTYDWTSYKYGTSDNLTKYNTKSSYGSTVDNLTTLEKADDIASLSWGGRWLIPTKAQIQELIAGCYWLWTDNYNSTEVAGFICY